MARISKYALDTSISNLDKLVGTDAEDSNITKNYTMESIGKFIAPTIAEGTINNMAMFSTVNKVVDATPVSMVQSTANGGSLIIGGNVSLGEFQLSAGQVAFDQTPTGATGVGVLRWNDTAGTLDLGLKRGAVTLQIGQEVVATVVNKSGADLLEADFRVVKVLGAQGQRLSVNLAQANSDTNSATTLGVVTETILNNQEGFITTTGMVNNINATGAKSFGGLETWIDGDIIYLDAVNAGYITNVKPATPAHLITIGYVVNAAVNGKIYVKIDNGYEIDELHDVLVTNPLESDILIYDAALSIWKNSTASNNTGIALKSPNGTAYKITVSDAGTLVVTAV
tara:strand:- start:76 stop:1095 length:1020 start_codon:yes stop_codon:yes gene_type:complete